MNARSTARRGFAEIALGDEHAEFRVRSLRFFNSSTPLPVVIDVRTIAASPNGVSRSWARTFFLGPRLARFNEVNFREARRRFAATPR